MKIDTSSFINVSQIIERDSKDTSYKFALLRATIDTISDYDQQIHSLHERVIIPTGLIVEKWIWYYYPLIDSEIFLPQKNGEPGVLKKGKNIKFRRNFLSLIENYSKYGEFAHFYNDYKKKKLNTNINDILKIVVNDIYKTITQMPMKYIGKSVTQDEYSIYKIEKEKSRIQQHEKITTDFLLRSYGTFSIPKDFYYVLKYLGSFIGGSNTLINGWADFILKANKKYPLEKEYVLRKLHIQPESYRDVGEVKNFYSKQNNLYCVWSNKVLNRNNTNIDHVLPFAHYLNNDIWNLLPTLNAINSKKRDKVPSPDLIMRSTYGILSYWEMLQRHFKEGFNEEVNISLAPQTDLNNISEWGSIAIESLQKKAEYLIEVRGLEPWDNI